jgi:hypothetical protein
MRYVQYRSYLMGRGRQIDKITQADVVQKLARRHQKLMRVALNQSAAAQRIESAAI